MSAQWRVTVVLLFLAGLALGAGLHKFWAQTLPASRLTADRERAFRELAANPGTLGTFPLVSSLVSESVVLITAIRRADGIFARTADSRGSGFVVDADGHILTNDHVVAGAEEIVVTLPDGTRLTPTVVGTDPDTDIALLKVAAANLRPVNLGDSDAVLVGEWVLAVGAPFGLANTVTAGIVSAKGRSGMTGPAYQGYIQTDAAVNPGNSGGPLVNLRGEVIGITSAMASPSGGYDGISFAIPANRAKFVMAKLRESGTVVRGYLGAQFADLNEDLVRWVNANTNVRAADVQGLREKLRYGDAKGVFVLDVVPGGPAQAAGLRLGDFITEINGQPVVSQPQLKEQIAGLTPGEEAALTFLRAGAPQRATVRVARRPTVR
ncbi:MAG: trypsin-like peptidase domain-containing protein [Candidatus Brocadiae bacterium]|nr:trypsin-like peptidase domain-containing protein [Candidatus Brocadiia bacterium]